MKNNGIKNVINGMEQSNNDTTGESNIPTESYFEQYKRLKLEGKEIPKKVKSKAVKTATRIKPFSDKRDKLNKEYSKLFKIEKEKRPYCEIRIEGVCTGKTQGMHHPHAKATVYLLLSVFKDGFTSCNACNTWIEANSAKAKELGFKTADYRSKLSNINKNK